MSVATVAQRCAGRALPIRPFACAGAWACGDGCDDCGGECAQPCGRPCFGRCTTGCDPCGDPCGDGCYGRPWYRGPVSCLFALFSPQCWCGPSCGERYWGDFYSDPPDCGIRAMTRGNYSGGGCRACGGSQSHARGYVDSGEWMTEESEPTPQADPKVNLRILKPTLAPPRKAIKSTSQSPEPAR